MKEKSDKVWMKTRNSAKWFCNRIIGGNSDTPRSLTYSVRAYKRFKLRDPEAGMCPGNN